MRLPRCPTLSVVATVLVLVLRAAPALARAGGGEHYAGGSDSNDSGGGGAIPIELVWFLVRITFEYPLVGIPIWIFVIWVFWQMNRSRAAPRTQRHVASLESARFAPEGRRDVGRIRAHDPAFDVDALARRAGEQFAQVQEAWFRRDLTPVRRHLSDATYRRFTTLLALMQAEGRRDALDDLRVRSVRPVAIGGSSAFDSVTFAIDAELRDTDVAATDSDDVARKKAAHAPLERFTELWTFVRRPDAQTRPEFLGQGKCPNCGAPFTGGASNTCEYCNAVVNSGNYDWVVSEITQPEAFVPHRARTDVVGPLVARDPAAGAELLEDRALLLFWKWIEAFSLVDARPLRKLSRPQAFDNVAAEVAKVQAKPPLLRVPAVGGADVVAVQLDDGGFDRVWVDVRWSASTGVAGPRPRRHVVAMERRSSARTDPRFGLSTERCGNCAAPLTNSDSTTCDFCGHDLAGADTEWQLAEVVAYEQWRRPAARPAPDLHAFAAPSERLRTLQLLAAVARADGVVDASEQKLLRDCARRWQVPWTEVAPLLDGDVDPFAPDHLDPEEGEELVRLLVAAARVDGRIDARERRLIVQVASHVGLSARQVEGLLG